MAASSAAGVWFIAVDTRSLDPKVDASTLLAVQCAIGFENRDDPLFYNLDDDYSLLWLQRLLPPNSTYVIITPQAFLAETLPEYHGILYTGNNTAENTTVLPSIVTMAGVLSAIPIDEKLYAQFPATKIVLDTRNLWATQLASVEYIYQHALSNTTTLAFQEGARLAVGYLCDWLVQQRIFIIYIKDACIPFTQPNALLHKIVNASPWKRPVRVYGYNSMDVIFGGDLFEAETNCINVMGQVASAQSNNLAFWSWIEPFVAGQQQGQPGGPMRQAPSPLIKYDPSKVYVSLENGDMDNIDFVRSFGSDHMLTRVSMCRQQPSKCFPLSWTLSPNLIQFAPQMLRWYYQQVDSIGLNLDWFLMPPSGTLYAYPGEMPDDTQAKYVMDQQSQAVVMNTTGSVHWEWIFQWNAAWKKYFPRYTNASAGPGTRGFFLNNVPWVIPIPDLFLKGETFRWLGDPKLPTSVVGFRPAFNWQEGEPSGGLPFNSSVIAGLVNGFARGSVQYIYVIQNTNMTSVFDMVSKLKDHVVLVGYQQLIDLARQAPPVPPPPHQ